MNKLLVILLMFLLPSILFSQGIPMTEDRGTKIIVALDDIMFIRPVGSSSNVYYNNKLNPIRESLDSLITLSVNRIISFQVKEAGNINTVGINIDNIAIVNDRTAGSQIKLRNGNVFETVISFDSVRSRLNNPLGTSISRDTTVISDLNINQTYNTIDDLLADTSIVEGAVATVLGYYTPNDGGGGRFVYRATSRKVTDGITVYAPLSKTAVRSPTTVVPQFAGVNLAVFPDSQLVFGSIQITWNNAGDKISDWILHGASLSSNGGITAPFINHRLGRLEGFVNTNYFANFFSQRTGGILVTYRYITGAGRWERINEGYLKPQQIGAKPYSATPPYFNSVDRLNWLEKAAYRNKCEIRFDTSFYYWGTIERMDNSRWIGISSVKSKLVVIPGDSVMIPQLTSHTRLPREWLGGEYTSILPAYGALRLYTERFTFDGNYDQNLRAFGAFASEYNNVENYLQNTPMWTAFSSTNHGGRSQPEGQVIEFGPDVVIQDYGSSGFLCSRRTRMIAYDLTVSNSLRNHAIYSYGPADINVLKIKGFSWNHVVFVSKTTINYLEIDSLTGNPYYGSTCIFNYRGQDAPGMKDATYNPYSSTEEPTSLHIKSFKINFGNNGATTGNTPNLLFGLNGDNVTIENGEVYVSTGSDIRLVQPINNGFTQSGNFETWVLRNTTVYLKAPGTIRGYPNRMENVVIYPLGDNGRYYAWPHPNPHPIGAELFYMSNSVGNAYNINPIRVDFRNVVGSQLAGHYFTLQQIENNVADTIVCYYFRVDGVGSAPGITAQVFVPINITSGANAYTIVDSIRFNTNKFIVEYGGRTLQFLIRNDLVNGYGVGFTTSSNPPFKITTKGLGRKYQPILYSMKNVKFKGIPIYVMPNVASLDTTNNVTINAVFESCEFPVIATGMAFNGQGWYTNLWGEKAYELVRILYKDCVFTWGPNRPGMTAWQSDTTHMWNRMCYFDNCVFRTTESLGLTYDAELSVNLYSEQVANYGYTAIGGETSILIPTKLFWKPRYYTARESLVSGLSVTNVVPVKRNLGNPNNAYYGAPNLRIYFNRALNPGEVININWYGAVNPTVPSSVIGGYGD